MNKLFVPILLLSLVFAGCGDDDEYVAPSQSVSTLSIDVSTPGTLASAISAGVRDEVVELTLTGRINGSDVAVLREMAGSDLTGGRTEGSLRRLDMSAVQVVEGGDAYFRDGDTDFVTSNNVIGDHFFDGCKSLVAVTLPTNVVRVGDNAFSDCYLLRTVGISTGVVEIGDEAFRFCHDLEGLELPLGLQTIGDRAFVECNSIKSLDLPVGLATIGAEAFEGCTSIADVYMPQGVQSIGYNAFKDCVALSELHCRAITPPACQTGTFEGVNRDVCRLFVPTGSADTYAAARGWQDFKNIIEE